MIFVIAIVELNPGRRNDFLTEFRKIVPLVRKERGCIEYLPTIDLHTDIAAQSPPRPEVVTIVEKWESLETLQAHLVAPHMEDYRPKVKPLIAKLTLQILQSA